MVAFPSHILLYEELGKNVTGLGENLFILMKNSSIIPGQKLTSRFSFTFAHL